MSGPFPSLNCTHLHGLKPDLRSLQLTCCYNSQEHPDVVVEPEAEEMRYAVAVAEGRRCGTGPVRHRLADLFAAETIAAIFSYFKKAIESCDTK